MPQASGDNGDRSGGLYAATGPSRPENDERVGVANGKNPGKRFAFGRGCGRPADSLDGNGLPPSLPDAPGRRCLPPSGCPPERLPQGAGRRQRSRDSRLPLVFATDACRFLCRCFSPDQGSLGTRFDRTLPFPAAAERSLAGTGVGDGMPPDERSLSKLHPAIPASTAAGADTPAYLPRFVQSLFKCCPEQPK